MNIFKFLTPKNQTQYLQYDATIRQALEKFDYYKFTVVPLIDEEGKFISTLSEGDILRYIKNDCDFNIEEAESKTIDNIEKIISNELNIQCTIHLDPINLNDETVAELRAIALQGIKNVDENISIHDFRVVTGVTHTNLIFDIVLPFESKLTPHEAKRNIETAINNIRNDLFCVITVDRG